MPRTWSNAKRPPSLGPSRHTQAGRPNSGSLFRVLLIVAAVWFFGLIAYTMIHVTRHPITELRPVNVQAPKED